MVLSPALSAVPAPHRPARPRPAPLRLTRRGRVVVRSAIGFGSALAVAAVMLGLGRSASAETSSRPRPVSYRVVLPGETLFGIAVEVDPKADPRDTAVRIARLNGLRDWALRAGQRLALPAGV